MQYRRPNMIFNFSQGAQHPYNNSLQHVGPIVGFAGVNHPVLHPVGRPILNPVGPAKPFPHPVGRPILNPVGPEQPFPHSPVLNPTGPPKPVPPHNTVDEPIAVMYPTFQHYSQGDSVVSPVGHPLLPNAHRGMNY